MCVFIEKKILRLKSCTQKTRILGIVMITRTSESLPAAADYVGRLGKAIELLKESFFFGTLNLGRA